MCDSHDATVYSNFHMLNLVNNASLCVSKLCLFSALTALAQLAVLSRESFTRIQLLPGFQFSSLTCWLVRQVDTMIVQAIGLLDDLDKELNTYAMRIREWYGWHFPEMTKIVADNIKYAKAVCASLLLH